MQRYTRKRVGKSHTDLVTELREAIVERFKLTFDGILYVMPMESWRQPGASEVLRRERRGLRPASAATPDAALASEPFIVSSLSGGLFSHIAEASGCRACPVGWAIAV